MNKIERIGGEGQPPPEPRSELREVADARDKRRSAAGPEPGTTTPERAGRRRMMLAIGAVVLVAAIILIWNWWESSSHYETTDDAFIDTHIVRVSPQIAGRVVRVLVNDNQLVQPGALLIEI